MRKTSILLLSIAMGLGLGACGKKPLTNEQKQAVKSTLDSAGQSSQASHDVGGAQNFTIDRDTNPNGGDLGSILSQRRQEGSCEFKMNDGDRSGQSGDLSKMGFSWEVKSGNGKTCPISLSVKMNFAAAGEGAKIDLLWNYSVTDAEFRKLNDVDSVDVKGTINVNKKGDNAAGYNGKVTGTINSQTKGAVTVESNVDGTLTKNGMDGTETLLVKFKDFEAEFKVEYSSNKTKYSVNGEELTQTQFNSYFEKLPMGFSPGGFSSGAGQSSQDAPTQAPPTTPGSPFPAN